MPKVSVIIPAYNVENYISKCIESVINQTLRDIEIIIIDDKSKDNTLAIIKDYAEKDARIKVIAFEKNQGVAVARNQGIDFSSGEYIGFVDPDDYIDLDFYEKLYNKAKKSDVDIVAGNVRTLLFNNKVEISTRTLKSFEESKYNFNYTLWLAIYKSSFIKENKIYNPVGVITSQDTVFCIKCAYLANRVEVVFDTFYHYIRVDNSLSSNILSQEKIMSKIEAMRLILDFVNSQNIDAEAYNSLTFGFFKFISLHAFCRNTKKDTRLLLMNASVDLYKKYKYKSYIKDHQFSLYKFLESEDVEGLYQYNCKLLEGGYGYSLKLFGRMPFIKVKKYFNREKYKIYILGIPLFSLDKSDGVEYYG